MSVPQHKETGITTHAATALHTHSHPGTHPCSLTTCTNPQGYMWQLVNCLLTAAYSLYIKRAIHAAERHMPRKQALAQSTMVLLNNVLSLPMLLGVLFCTGELQHMPHHASALSSMVWRMRRELFLYVYRVMFIGIQGL